MLVPELSSAESEPFIASTRRAPFKRIENSFLIVATVFIGLILLTSQALGFPRLHIAKGSPVFVRAQAHASETRLSVFSPRIDGA